MTLIHPALVLCASLALAACSIGKPMPQATTYVIELPAATPGAARRPETLRMANVRVAAAFAGDALGNRMAQWLDRAGPFQSVVQPDSVRGAPYILEATVSELYGDFRPGHAPAAVVTVQFALLDLTGARSKVVLERTISRRVAVQEVSPDALVRGYGTALAEILAELQKDLERNIAG